MSDRAVVIALEGGLLRTNPALELFWHRLGTNPRAAFRGGSSDDELRADLLPLNREVVSEIETQIASGKSVALSSARYPAIAEALAEMLGLTTSPERGERRAQRWHLRDLARALRPHQWVKNILLFLPLLAAHRFDSGAILLALLGIIAFSAAASSIYVVNDLIDLEADRLHPKKCKRPFASGTVPLNVGMLAGLVLVSIALGLGSYLGAKFLAITLLYVFVSVTYSVRLKRMRWVDIFLLAALYSLRVVAGAAAVDLKISAAMLFFIFPVFLTLGAVKRLTELTLAKTDARLPGRGYGRADRGKLLNFAVLSMIASLIVFFLYSQSAQAKMLYPDRWFLWLAIAPLAAWLFRMVRLGYYGKQDYDPIVFALRDKRGIGLILITLSLMFYAAGLWAEWFGAVF